MHNAGAKFVDYFKEDLPLLGRRLYCRSFATKTRAQMEVGTSISGTGLGQHLAFPLPYTSCLPANWQNCLLKPLRCTGERSSGVQE